jgi:hypothetical protein
VFQTSTIGSNWQGSLEDLASIVLQIKRRRAFGLLTLRNSERLSIAHLYFRAGKFVHIAGNRGNVQSILAEVREWRNGVVRFTRGAIATEITLDDEHELLLIKTLTYLQRRKVVSVPADAHIVEGSAVVMPDARPAITSAEWRILAEGMRRVRWAIAHLVGVNEALHVLHDIFDDCVAAFPAFSCLSLNTNGCLQINDLVGLERMGRREILYAFSALFTSCQYYCAPIIGDCDAYRLMLRALQEVGPMLIKLGVLDEGLRNSPVVICKRA